MSAGWITGVIDVFGERGTRLGAGAPVSQYGYSCLGAQSMRAIEIVCEFEGMWVSGGGALRK